MVDLPKTTKILQQFGKKARFEFGRALFNRGEDILKESTELVPVKTGNLKSNKLVSKPNFKAEIPIVEVGYGGPAAPYALRVHEEHASQSKFLERPFNAAQRTLDRDIAAELKARLRETR